MRLTVKQNGRNISEFRFTKGPVHIGRGMDSQVFLPDRIVSRQHAVIFSTPDGKWMVEDLDSANKTYLNDRAIHKSQIESGDKLRIADFTIEIELEAEAEADKPTRLEDTLITILREPQVIARTLSTEHATDISFPAKRAKDFLQATETICKADSPDQVLQSLLNVTMGQFSAYHTWCALRNVPKGPMTFHAGRRRDGQGLQLKDIKLNEKITEAVEKGQFLLIPKASGQSEEKDVGSVMIAPVIDPDGCFGVLYVANAPENPPYTLGDLDYLMLLAIHTAAIVENF